MTLTLLIALACIVFLLTVLIISVSLTSGVVPMPSLPSERRLVADVLKTYPDIKTLYDLGSGWGGLARYLERRLPGRRITAVETSHVPHLFSKIISKLTGHTVYSERRDLFEITLKNDEAYITYLSGASMKKLRKSFERDHPTGCVLVSLAFAMPGWTPARTEWAEGLLRTAAYVYEI